MEIKEKLEKLSYQELSELIDNLQKEIHDMESEILEPGFTYQKTEDELREVGTSMVKKLEMLELMLRVKKEKWNGNKLFDDGIVKDQHDILEFKYDKGRLKVSGIDEDFFKNQYDVLMKLKNGE